MRHHPSGLRIYFKPLTIAFLTGWLYGTEKVDIEETRLLRVLVPVREVSASSSWNHSFCSYRCLILSEVNNSRREVSTGPQWITNSHAQLLRLLTAKSSAERPSEKGHYLTKGHTLFSWTAYIKCPDPLTSTWDIFEGLPYTHPESHLHQMNLLLQLNTVQLPPALNPLLMLGPRALLINHSLENLHLIIHFQQNPN